MLLPILVPFAPKDWVWKKWGVFDVLLWSYCFSVQYLIYSVRLEVYVDFTLRPYLSLRSGLSCWMEFGKGIRKYRVWAHVWNVQWRAFNWGLSILRAPPVVANNADTTEQDDEGNKKKRQKRKRQTDRLMIPSSSVTFLKGGNHSKNSSLQAPWCVIFFKFLLERSCLLDKGHLCFATF